MTLWQERILPLFVSKGMEKSNEIADAIGCNVRLVYHWNKDGYTSYNKYYPQIAKALGVSIAYISGESDELTPIPQEGDGLSDVHKRLMADLPNWTQEEAAFVESTLMLLRAKRQSQGSQS